MTPDPRAAARELLAFYREAGVEDLVGESPVDRFAAVEPDAQGSAPARPAINAPARRPSLAHAAPAQATPRPAAVPIAPEAATMAAREAARTAATLDDLRAVMEAFEGCMLRLTAKQLVFGDGNPQARVMFVGEAPGREEDLEGRPFVGPSGLLLDRMLAAIGLDRATAYIANIIPWRPPGNRDPSMQETQICLPFIRRQIELVDPDLLVCLGKPATVGLLGIADGIKRMRGRFYPYETGTREIRALPMFHPAFLLRSPLEKRLAWRDLLAIKRTLGE